MTPNQTELLPCKISAHGNHRWWHKEDGTAQCLACNSLLTKEQVNKYWPPRPAPAMASQISRPNIKPYEGWQIIFDDTGVAHHVPNHETTNNLLQKAAMLEEAVALIKKRLSSGLILGGEVEDFLDRAASLPSSVPCERRKPQGLNTYPEASSYLEEGE